MTDQQPRTAAGRALLAESEGNTYAPEDRELFLDDILAIEAEARDTAVSETAMEAVRQHRAEAAALDVERLTSILLNFGYDFPGDRPQRIAAEYARLASDDRPSRPPLPPPGSGRSKEIGRRIDENFDRLNRVSAVEEGD